ncbi:ThiF family adenylyltransferase [Mariniflexile ostreae]|uniref:ThiF family adenylyltransferase n=1 Tax=Mariniflexile ostreae TaxID=1520892 RepID=A0ABV5FBJ4_9FLAO
MNLSRAEKQHYSRHLLLDAVGLEGQLKLKEAKVLVIGAGGLGCPILQYLTAAGVGEIGVIDNDVIEQSNLQRQILYTYPDIGKSKSETAVKRLQLLNPFVECRAYNIRLTKANALKLFKPYDIIVDGTDNFPTRYLINDAAVLLNKPVVFGSIFKFEGQVSVFNFKKGPTYRCLFPTPPKSQDVPNCSEIGVLGILPGIIGNFQANEVLKIILGIGDVLTGKLLTFNALSMTHMLFTCKKNKTITIKALHEDYNGFCGIQSPQKSIHFEAYKNQASHFNVLDVRTLEERHAYHIESIHIPLQELSERHHEIPQDKALLVYCQSGIRSKMAIELLQNNGFKNELVNLKDGIMHIDMSSFKI